MSSNEAEEVIYEIVTALAAAEDVHPRELEYSLPEYLDPAALVEMLAVDSDAWEFTVQVPGHEVTVTHAREIFIDGARYGQIDESSVQIGDSDEAGEGGEGDEGDESDETVDEFIRESLPYSQTLLNNIPCMLYRCGYQRTWPMQFISGNCRTLTGYDPNAFVIGGVSYGEDVIHAADQQPVWNAVQDALRTADRFSQIHRIRTADGVVEPVWNKGVGVVADDEIVAIVGFVTTPPTEADIHPEEFTEPLHP